MHASTYTHTQAHTQLKPGVMFTYSIHPEKKYAVCSLLQQQNENLRRPGTLILGWKTSGRKLNLTNSKQNHKCYDCDGDAQTWDQFHPRTFQVETDPETFQGPAPCCALNESLRGSWYQPAVVSSQCVLYLLNNFIPNVFGRMGVHINCSPN